MLKVLYFFPAVITLIFFGFLALLDFSSLNPIAWLFVSFLFISAILMSKNKWWGCIFGVFIGGIYIYLGTQDAGQIVNESPTGMGVCLYYFICGFICYRKNQT